MVDSFLAESNRIVVTKNDKISFDTNRKSIHLFDANKIVLNGVTVQFPNLVSTIYYKHVGTVGNATSCETYSAILPQEHGTGFGNYSPTDMQYIGNRIPIQRELPAIYLGSVPAGTTYIDVRAKLIRTITPPTFQRFISPPLLLLPENEWIDLPGGSCICEYFFPLSRMFNVIRSGNDIYLYRYQSTWNSPSQTITTTGGNENNVTSSRQGSEWGNYPEAPIYWALPTVFFDVKGPSGSSNKRPPWGSTSNDSCSVGSIVNYTSQYSVDLIITPGRFA